MKFDDTSSGVIEGVKVSLQMFLLPRGTSVYKVGMKNGPIFVVMKMKIGKKMRNLFLMCLTRKYQE